MANVDAEIVATLSAHSLPAGPDWLRTLDRAVRSGRASRASTVDNCRASNATFLELVGMRLTGVLSDTPRMLDRRPLFSNANGAFRRSLWLEHPFDERVGGAEDIAWVRTMQERGYLIAYQPTAARVPLAWRATPAPPASSEPRRADGHRQPAPPGLGS